MLRRAAQALATTMTSQAGPSRPLRSVVAVVGSTGVGKSQLAVSLCNSLPTLPAASDFPRQGKVLSADSMQLYKGLDVITNKVTEEEKGGVEHWGLDVVQPGQGGSWELRRWCSEADQELEKTPLSTLPVICGGTHYFIQHFLFPPDELSFDCRKDPEGSDPLALRWTPPRACPPTPGLDPHLKALLDTFWRNDAVYPPREGAEDSDAEGLRVTSRPVADTDHELLSMWKLLEAIDPNDAPRWHWRDERKVRRSIERWWERGGVDVEKPVVEDTARSGRSARFRTLIFWVYEPIANLRDRLDGRVEKMVDNGLLDEIEELRHVALRLYGSEEATDLAEGIFQAIGYKEFAGLSLPQNNPGSNPQFDAMLGRMKTSTHQYAKQQIKWIRKQLLPAVHEARSRGGDVHIYVVPGGAAGEPLAQSVLASFLAGEALPDPMSVGHADAPELLKTLSQEPTKVADTVERQVINAHKVCPECSAPGKPFVLRGEEWKVHLTSKIHKRNIKMGGMSKEEWIASLKAKGLARKAELDKEREQARLNGGETPEEST